MWRVNEIAWRVEAPYRHQIRGRGKPGQRGGATPKSEAVLVSMLEVRSVSRRFGGVMAVDAVSMAVGRGEIVGLIGPNGAGKTTLFNLIAGTLRPSAGRILLEGAAIEGEPAHRGFAAASAAPSRSRGPSPR